MGLPEMRSDANQQGADPKNDVEIEKVGFGAIPRHINGADHG